MGRTPWTSNAPRCVSARNRDAPLHPPRCSRPYHRRGFAHVTVEDIAEAADISPRTFFNYFPSKEAALFGADHERTEALRQRLLDQPADVAPLDALRAALVGEACAVAEELGELGGDQGAWLAHEGRQRRPTPAGSSGSSHGSR